MKHYFILCILVIDIQSNQNWFDRTFIYNQKKATKTLQLSLDPYIKKDKNKNELIINLLNNNSNLLNNSSNYITDNFQNITEPAIQNLITQAKQDSCKYPRRILSSFISISTTIRTFVPIGITYISLYVSASILFPHLFGMNKAAEKSTLAQASLLILLTEKRLPLLITTTATSICTGMGAGILTNEIFKSLALRNI